MMGDMTLTEALHDHAFLAGLPAAHLGKLSQIACPVAFGENELILLTAQQSHKFYLLLTGTVCVEFRTRAYSVRIQTLGHGDAFGWSALLDQHDTLFQVRAHEPATALSLDSADLAALFSDDPALAAEIYRRALRLVAGRVQATEAKLGELCGVKIPRLA
jgi:CRP/FNR family cyclic AMP-dependent transcriptional regulator